MVYVLRRELRDDPSLALPTKLGASRASSSQRRRKTKTQHREHRGRGNRNKKAGGTPAV
jgi:hypothetical protein